VLFVCVLGQAGTCALWCTALYNASMATACGLTTGNGPAFSDGTTASCLSFCNGLNPAMPAGMITDTTGNTLGCRTYHATVAAAQTGTYNIHCDHGTVQSANGNSSTGQCGGLCENYCFTMMSGGCAGMYPDTTTCNTVCNTFQNTIYGGSYTVNSNLAANWQDNIECRTYHGSAPSVGAGAVTHCPHAYVTGGGACIAAGDTYGCAAYCKLLLATCSSYPEVAGDTQATCMTRCTGAVGTGTNQISLKNYFNFSDPLIASGCSIDCRVYHLINAISTGSTATHCPHAYVNAASGTPCACAGASTAGPTPGPTPTPNSGAGLIAVFALVVTLCSLLIF